MGDKVTLESIDARLDNIEKLIEKVNGRSINNSIAIAGIKGFVFAVPTIISVGIAAVTLWWNARSG
jgi:hypothetical protein